MNAEEWDEENLALRERIRLGREMRGITPEELARLTRISPGLVRMIETDRTLVTHPNIVARVFAEVGIRDRRMMRHLTNKCRWNYLPRIPRQRSAKTLARVRAQLALEAEERKNRYEMSYAQKLQEWVSDRHMDAMHYWHMLGLNEKEFGIPIRVKDVKEAVEARRWSPEEASRRFGYRHSNGYEKAILAGKTTRDRCEYIAAALGCDLDVIVDLDGLEAYREHLTELRKGRRAYAERRYIDRDRWDG